MMRFRLALALFATLALAGCYPPTTKTPVGLVAGLKPDPVLAGLWKGESADHKPGYFHFLPQDDGSTTILIVEGGGKPSEWNFASVTTGKAGGNRFMNARLLSSNGKPDRDMPKLTIPVLYRVDAKGTLTLALMNEKKTKDAIRAGKIKGDPGQGDSGDATLTADPQTLDKFMATPAAVALFDAPFFTLRRVN